MENSVVEERGVFRIRVSREEGEERKKERKKGRIVWSGSVTRE